MNAHLFTDQHGLRLIQEFEGAPRLKARLCEGGAWELSYGCTFYADGSAVQEGDTCTEDQALAMFRHALGVFEEAVKAAVTIPLNSHQFSALVAFAYNVGIDALKSSTVLRETNKGRFYDAAAAFGMWIFATKNGHKQAYRGLLRRRYAEACLYLSYDWTTACDIDSIALTREPPETLPGTDRVRYKTPFKEVLAVAQRYPLPALPAELILDKPLAPESVPAATGGQPVQGSQPPAPAVPAAKQNTAGASPPAAQAGEGAGVSRPSPPPPAGQATVDPTAPPAKPSPVPAKPAPAPAPTISTKPPEPPEPPPSLQQQRDAVNASGTPGIDPSSAKSMLLSRRFWGLLMIISGRVVFAIWGTDTLLKLGSDPIVSEMVANVMVMMAASAWEYCGEMLHTWGRARAKRPLR